MTAAATRLESDVSADIGEYCQLPDSSFYSLSQSAIIVLDFLGISTLPELPVLPPHCGCRQVAHERPILQPLTHPRCCCVYL